MGGNQAMLSSHGPMSPPSPGPGLCLLSPFQRTRLGRGVRRELGDGKSKETGPCCHCQAQSRLRTSSEANHKSDQREGWEMKLSPRARV